MNDSIKRISLDIHSNSSKETVNAKRGDTARKLIISLVDGGLPYIISEDCYAVFTAKKPGGNVIYNDCTIKDNTIIYEFTEQTVAKEGRVNCEIKLYGANDKLITSPKFTIIVDNNVYNEGDEIESSDEFSALTKMVGDAKTATENANAAAEKAIRAADSCMVIGSARGENITLTDAIEQYLMGLRIYGKTTQDGTPTPDAPVDLVSVENPTIMVNEQPLLIPYTLHGIPVTFGGNYTNADGQRWICDEIDFARGVYVKRIETMVCDGSTDEKWEATSDPYFGILTNNMPYPHKRKSEAVLSSHLPRGSSGASITLGNKYGLYVLGTSFSSLAEWTEFLASQSVAGSPMTAMYELEEPIETPLSEEELAAYAALHTYRDHTTVSNDAGAYMELEYVMDAKKYIDSLVGSATPATGTILPATVE